MRARGAVAEEHDPDNADRNPFVYLSGSIAAVWAVVGWLNPESNYFLFPFIVAAVMPIAYRLHGGPRLSWPAGLGAGVAGLINVAIVALLLRIGRRLDGVPLVDGMSLLLEALLLGVIGALLGATIAHLVPGGKTTAS